MSDNSTVATVHRTHVGDHFLIVSNAMCRGQMPVPLKVMARAILLHLLSLPEGWKIDRAQIDRGFVEGEKAVDTGLKELKAKGYLRQTKYRAESGKWVWTWQVTDDPIHHPLSDHPWKTGGWTEQGKPDSAQVAPSPGKPPVVSRPIPEDGLENTESKTPLVLDEGLEVETSWPSDGQSGDQGAATIEAAPSRCDLAGTRGHLPIFCDVCRGARGWSRA